MKKIFNNKYHTFTLCLDRQTIIDSLNKNASSGLPLFRKKRDMLYKVDEVLEAFHREDFVSISKYFELPAVIFRVVQPGKSETFKNRLIYGPPIEVTITEIIFGFNFVN